MVYNRNLVDGIVKAIFPLPERFGLTVDFDWGETILKELDDIKKKILRVDPEVEVRFGMSKIVFISPNLKGVVIKIPFNGYFLKTEKDNDDSYEWYPFESAPGTDSSDYCYTEYEKYLELKNIGLSQFVAETEYFKAIDEVKIFVQEKVISSADNEYDYNASFNSKQIATEWDKDNIFSFSDTEWIANCIDKYGEEKTKNFLFYCTNEDTDICEDAHHHNYGYRANGTPAFLDYSNYLD